MSSSKAIQIAGHTIGPGHRPFVIAEMSGNHNQSLERAKDIIAAAARAGAHAIKLQTYTADTMTLDMDVANFRIDDPKSLWNGASLYELYDQAHTPWEWHAPLFDHARSLGLVVFSTPFDETAVDFLETLDVPCYKIASFENTDLPLIRRVAATGKPMIISTGMASLSELDDCVRTARASGCRDLILLKCTSTYPAAAHNSNLLTIPHLQDLFGVHVGLSDHTMGIGAAVAAVALGACLVEKHFTLRRADGGVDSAFSLEPEEFASLAIETERAWQALGQVSYGPTEAERPSLQFRRSLFVVHDLKAGDRLTRENVRALRPGLGMAPKHLDRVLGNCVLADVARGTPLTSDLISSR